MEGRPRGSEAARTRVTRRVLIEPAAKNDIHEARDWYAAIRPDLGQEFVDKVSLVIDRLHESTDGSLPFPANRVPAGCS